MNNRQITDYINSLKENRRDWIESLVALPSSTAAPQNILAINHKIDLLLTFWDWSDTSLDYPR